MIGRNLDHGSLALRGGGQGRSPGDPAASPLQLQPPPCPGAMTSCRRWVGTNEWGGTRQGSKQRMGVVPPLIFPFAQSLLHKRMHDLLLLGPTGLRPVTLMKSRLATRPWGAQSVVLVSAWVSCPCQCWCSLGLSCSPGPSQAILSQDLLSPKGSIGK